MTGLLVAILLASTKRFVHRSVAERRGPRKFIAEKFFTACNSLEELWIDCRIRAVALRKPDGAMPEVVWSCASAQCCCPGAGVPEPVLLAGAYEERGLQDVH